MARQWQGHLLLITLGSHRHVSSTRHRKNPRWPGAARIRPDRADNGAWRTVAIPLRNGRKRASPLPGHRSDNYQPTSLATRPNTYQLPSLPPVCGVEDVNANTPTRAVGWE